MTRHEQLIQSLTDDLAPVKPVMSPDWLAILWLLGTALFVVLFTAFDGPLRPGVFDQLRASPRFLAEMALGLTAITLLAFCAFRAAQPGRLQRRFATISAVLLGLWLVQYLVAFWSPALPLSTVGARHACWLETIGFAIGPMLVAFFLTRRWYPLNPWHTTLSFSLVTGLLPAWYMQLACMYNVPHGLEFHILPGLAVALAGSCLALLYRRNRIRAPR